MLRPMILYNVNNYYQGHLLNEGMLFVTLPHASCIDAIFLAYLHGLVYKELRYFRPVLHFNSFKSWLNGLLRIKPYRPT